MKRFFCGFLFLITPLLSHSYLAEKTVGSIGESFVSLSSVRLYRKRLRAGLIYPTTLFKISNKKKLLSNEKKLISFMLMDLMVYKITKDTNFEASPEQVALALKRLKKKQGHAQFAKRLSRFGYTLKSFRKDLKTSLKKDFIIRQTVFSKIKISEDDINSHYFNKYKKNLYTSFEYDFSFISFPKNEKGLRKIRKALRLIKSSSFKKASAAFSPQKKILKSSQLDSRMEKILKNLSISKTSPIAPIDNKLYIFSLHWKTPALNLKQEKTKQNIEAFLIERELKRELKEWLDEQKEHFFIKISSL